MLFEVILLTLRRIKGDLGKKVVKWCQGKWVKILGSVLGYFSQNSSDPLELFLPAEQRLRHRIPADGKGKINLCTPDPLQKFAAPKFTRLQHDLHRGQGGRRAHIPLFSREQSEDARTRDNKDLERKGRFGDTHFSGSPILLLPFQSPPPPFPHFLFLLISHISIYYYYYTSLLQSYITNNFTNHINIVTNIPKTTKNRQQKPHFLDPLLSPLLSPQFNPKHNNTICHNLLNSSITMKSSVSPSYPPPQ